MRLKSLALLCTVVICAICYGSETNVLKYPTVGIAVLVRNKAHTLPYFLTCLRNLEYPKDRMYIWIHTDFNEDNSIEIIEKWSKKYASSYNEMHVTMNKTSGPLHPDEKIATQWTHSHFNHVIKLREAALNFARKKWADFLFMIDADVFLTNRATLKTLVRKSYAVSAPMLLSDGLYSNFWCGMTSDYYYKRTPDYQPMLSREKTGCFEVPMVHSAVLVMLKQTVSDHLTYDPKNIKKYDGPEDDIIAFAVNANKHGIKMHVCNEDNYGFVTVPLHETDDIKKDIVQLRNVKVEAISRGTPIPLDAFSLDLVSYPEANKMGCSEIYMINLVRRKERRLLMDLSFRELGMAVKLVKAFDGRDLDMQDLTQHSIVLMPGYEDPYHKRPMKAGEVGCFLSHYSVWMEIVEKKHKISFILEDDIHFVPFFRQRFLDLLEELKHADWDLVYIGRKILQDTEEEYVTKHTTRALYSYWTLGYLLSERGAKKLINAEPLTKMLPVDEFLPIMFDQHPNDTWKSRFENRNLVALSASPLLVYPTHYTGQMGHISDTEDSDILTPMYESLKNEL